MAKIKYIPKNEAQLWRLQSQSSKLELRGKRAKLQVILATLYIEDTSQLCCGEASINRGNYTAIV